MSWHGLLAKDIQMFITGRRQMLHSSLLDPVALSVQVCDGFPHIYGIPHDHGIRHQVEACRLIALIFLMALAKLSFMGHKQIPA
jgi:hypothetical protein